MSRHKNLMMRICCAAVLSLGLAACGGKTVPPTTPVTPVTRTHVLGLFKSANAYDVTEEKAAAAEVKRVGMAIAAAAERDNEDDGGQAGGATASAAWVADTPDDSTTDADETMDGLLKITFNSGVAEGTTEFTSDTVGDDDDDPVVKPNAKQTNVGGDFPHLFDISSGNARVLIFTDKEQETAVVPEVTAMSLVNATIMADQIASLGESRDDGTSFPGAYDDDGVADTPAIEGTFTCTGDSCSLVYTGSGDDVTVTAATGYTFSGSRESVKAVAGDEKRGYLLFGVWLDEVAEGDDAGDDTFGAVAMGGEAFTANNVEALKGKATYSGTTVGAHHKTGSGVSSFDGDANLTADFGTDDANDFGSIDGTIDNISVDGGDPMEEPIHLVKAPLSGIASTFEGKAVMGQQLGPGQADHTFNGTWSGGFFGNGETDTDHPGSVAGTFGVTNTRGMDDDAVTESYVGAFGAHQQ